MSGEVIACSVITEKRAHIPASILNVATQLKSQCATAVGTDAVIFKSGAKAIEQFRFERPYPFRFLHESYPARFCLSLSRLR